MSPNSSGTGPRSFGRRRSLLHALVLMPRRHPVRCLVQEIHNGDALIEFAKPVSLPQRFQLLWEEIGVSVECEVRHAEGTRAEIGFLSDQGAMIARYLGPDPANAPAAERDFAPQPPRRDTELRGKNVGGDLVQKMRGLRRTAPGKNEQR